MVRRRKAATPISEPSAALETSHHLHSTSTKHPVVISKTSVVEDKDRVEFLGSEEFSEEDKAVSRQSKYSRKVQICATTWKPRPAKGTGVFTNYGSKALHNKNVEAFAHQFVKAPKEIKNISIDSPLSTSSNDVEAIKLAPNAWGETRFSRESAMVKAHADMLLRAEIIDQDTATKFSEPWHTKGILVHPACGEKYLDPSKMDLDTEIMSYEKAKKIQWRKDAEEKKFLERWRAGLIDENGKPTKKEGDLSVIEEDGVGQVFAPKSKNPLPPLNAMPSIIEQVTPSSSESSSSLGSQRAPFILSKQTEPRKSEMPRASTGSLEFDIPNYSSFNYYQLTAICRERGLRSGGCTENLRHVLITDDKNIKNGRDRENLLRYRPKNRRAYKTKVPVLESSGGDKRKRDAQEGGDGSEKRAKA